MLRGTTRSPTTTLGDLTHDPGSANQHYPESMSQATDLLQFLDERTDDDAPGGPSVSWNLRVGLLRWVTDQRGGVAGAWVLTVGAHDRVLHGVDRGDRGEALERSRRFVAEYMSSVSHHYVD